MDDPALLAIGILLAVLLLVSDIVQMFWVARLQTHDYGPRDRTKWERTTVHDLRPGDVLLSSAVSSRPETVIAADRQPDGRVLLTFRSSRVRTVPADTPVRRHRHPANAG